MTELENPWVDEVYKFSSIKICWWTCLSDGWDGGIEIGSWDVKFE